MATSAEDARVRAAVADRDVLSFGPRNPRWRPSRGKVLAVTAVVIVLVAAGVVRLLDRPARDFTAEDLAGVYAGMVRADGQNEVSVLERFTVEPTTLKVSPAACAPLFDQTLGNVFPPSALDGVSTYWLNEGSASISMFTYRYPDTATAHRMYQTVSDLVPACNAVVVDGQRLELEPLAGFPSQLSVPQVAYGTTAPGGGEFSTHLFQLRNTVTWQYRYDYGPDPHAPTALRQLADATVLQMQAVLAAATR